MAMEAHYQLPSSAYTVETMEVEEDGWRLCLKISARKKDAICPYCGGPSERIHSWYERQPHAKRLVRY